MTLPSGRSKDEGGSFIMTRGTKQTIWCFVLGVTLVALLMKTGFTTWHGMKRSLSWGELGARAPALLFWGGVFALAAWLLTPDDEGE